MALGQLLGLSPHLRAHRASRSACGSCSGPPRHSWSARRALFALDAVARHWHFTERARLALALVGALGVANVVGGWGHPEDCVAARARRVGGARARARAVPAGAPRAALLLGVGIAFQPLALSASRRCWPASAGAAPPACPGGSCCRALVVLVPPLVAEPHRTLFVLVHQPFEPQYNSFTPLTRSGARHRARARRRRADPAASPSSSGPASPCVVCHRRHDLDGARHDRRRLLHARPARDGDELVLPLARPGAVPAARVAPQPDPVRRSAPPRSS